MTFILCALILSHHTGVDPHDDHQSKPYPLTLFLSVFYLILTVNILTDLTHTASQEKTFCSGFLNYSVNWLQWNSWNETVQMTNSDPDCLICVHVHMNEPKLMGTETQGPESFPPGISRLCFLTTYSRDFICVLPLCHIQTLLFMLHEKAVEQTARTRGHTCEITS